MCTRKLKNRSDHATFHVVFIHFERDEKKEAKRRRLNNASLTTTDVATVSDFMPLQGVIRFGPSASLGH